MGKPFKQDYLALQGLWRDEAARYLANGDNDFYRLKIINDFKDSLIDITVEGKKAIYSNFTYWEKNVWFPKVYKQLAIWEHGNEFEAKDINNRNAELERIMIDYNHERFHKIMQLIQDSGIGLGQGREVKTVDRKGYQDG